jgi:hypothetical protein
MNRSAFGKWQSGVSLGMLVFVAGCGPGSPLPPGRNSGSASTEASGKLDSSTANDSESTDDSEHGHKPGQHGGILVSLGRDSFHAEGVFEAGGVLRLYMLGQDETRVIDVERQSLKAFVRRDDEASAAPFVLEPEPQEGDAEGRTSQFVGRLPEGLAGQAVEVTIPNLTIGGERFRVGLVAVGPRHEESMPDRVAASEEESLYLTVGGKYTQADIDANGRVTASKKFRGVKSMHDMSPKPGDRICPVTRTKANPRFTWIVDGQPYQFCCPPCVDEFVKTAKQSPEEIEPADRYVKSP